MLQSKDLGERGMVRISAISLSVQRTGIQQQGHGWSGAAEGFVVQGGWAPA
jgi:hypothetical protein